MGIMEQQADDQIEGGLHKQKELYLAQDKLQKWLKHKIEKTKDEGKEMFMGVPDQWYEKGLHCCCNGHIGTMYLKSEEKGPLCLACHEKSYMFPSDATQEDLDKALS